MKAFVYVGPGQKAIQERPKPEIQSPDHGNMTTENCRFAWLIWLKYQPAELMRFWRSNLRFCGFSVLLQGGWLKHAEGGPAAFLVAASGTETAACRVSISEDGFSLRPEVFN